MIPDPASSPTFQSFRFNHSLALLTDLYQLTMAYADWKSGIEDHEAVFHLYFRKNPFQGGFSVACGLGYVLDFLSSLKFTSEETSYLAQLEGNDGRPLFPEDFLNYLEGMKFSCDVDAVPEGTIVFPQEPLVRIQGPLLQCQILETPILNMVNFQTLIATKAARVFISSHGEPVVEFGLRRAQGIDGALAASRAAYIGGCAGTSNVLAGRLFGIPVKGTHAHSWVMAFDDELESFLAYARAMPNNCIFLVDTYDSLEGIRKAVKAGQWLREQGHKMIGIRLDSGDLAYLSIEARNILDEAGFPDAVVMASNELDEHIISSLKEQDAAIDVWGVGTKLVTAFEEPALGGVYKLSALRKLQQAWDYKVKLSEQAIKISTPGRHQVRRFFSGREYLADVIYDLDIGIHDGCTMIDPMDSTRRKQIATGTGHEDLLVPVFRHGELIYKARSIDESKQRVQGQLSRFHSGIKRFVNPHQYPVGLEQHLHELRTKLILQARGLPSNDVTQSLGLH
jgi:nicotinate phosphoribosyltransferase